MSNPILPPPATRFLAIDLHKDYAVIGGVSPQLETVLPPRRIELPRWSTWAAVHLKPTDILVIESTSNAWDFYDQVSPLVSKVVVANPRPVKLISSGRVKTDKVDTMALARLLAANLIPEVWVPPIVVRDARGLLAHRRRLVRNRTMVTNRLQSLLLRHNLPAPEGNPFSLQHRAQLRDGKLAALILDERVFHFWSCEKTRTAFFLGYRAPSAGWRFPSPAARS